MVAPMTRDEVLTLLRAEISAAGTARDWAEKHGVSAPYISDVLNRHRAPGTKILEALGLERVVTYRKVRR